MWRRFRPIADKSLEQLDGNPWGTAPAGATGLVETIHRLRTVPVGHLSPGDLRVLIGQQEGLRWLLPIALRVLIADPLVEGSYYEGDLLTLVARSKPVTHAGRGVEELVADLLDALDRLPVDVIADAGAEELVAEVTLLLRSPE